MANMYKSIFSLILLTNLTSLILSSCSPGSLSSGPVTPADTGDSAAKFEAFAAVVKTHCLSCHGEGSANGDFSGYETSEQWLASKSSKSGLDYFKKGVPEGSMFFNRLKFSSASPTANMPKGSESFTTSDLEVIKIWIISTDPNNASTPILADTHYYQHAGPVLQSRCVSCHQEGEIASSLPLSSYDDAFMMKDAIVSAVNTRRMPPWGVEEDGSCGTYQNSHYLSNAEIDTLKKWTAQGGSPGTKVTLPAPPVIERIAEPTIIGKTPNFTPKGVVSGTDEFRCFAMEINSENMVPQLGADAANKVKNLFVTSYDIRPSNKLVAHHALVFFTYSKADVAINTIIAEVDGKGADGKPDGRPGWACNGGSGLNRNKIKEFMFAGWAPGRGMTNFPSGTGVPLVPDSLTGIGGIDGEINNPTDLNKRMKIIIQMHYNLLNVAPGQSATDSTSLDLILKTGQIPGKLTLLGPIDINLPPAKTSTMSPTLSLPVPKKLYLHSGGPHMHLFGRGGKLEVQRKGQTTNECLMNAPRYDYNWQNNYQWTTPKILNQDDVFKVSCEYNTMKLPPGSPNVTFGEETGEEMCFFFLYTTESIPSGTP